MKNRLKQIMAAAMAGVLIAGSFSYGMPERAYAKEEAVGIEWETRSSGYETDDPGELEISSRIETKNADARTTVWEQAEENSEKIEYSGTWIDAAEGGHSNGGAKQSDAVGARASFTFTGTGIQWFGQTDINYTKAKVYLDGELIGTPDCKGDAQYQKEIYSLIGIPYGEHTFVIESQGPPNTAHNQNFIELDYLKYTEDQTPVTADEMQILNEKRSMNPGEQLKLEVALKKGTSQVYGKDISFQSSNPSVAEIDGQGLISAKADGSTEITVSGNGLEKSFALTVKAKQIAEMRRVIDSEHPLFYHHLYRQGNWEILGQRKGSLQGGLDIQTFWDALDQAMTPDIKQYQAILIHASGNINDNEETRVWYKEQMEKTVKDQIPFFLMISNSYTDQPFDNGWLAEMYETYPNMLGLVYSENHASVWQGHGGYRSEEIASKLELSSQYGGYVIFADTNNYDEYMESTLKNDVLMEALEKYSKNFIIMPKYTSQWSMAGYNSYQSVAMGTWLSGYAGNWGSLIDSWQWWDLYYYNDPFRADRVERLGGGEECRHPFSFPELMYPIRMISEANSGASVFSFEHPMYSTAVARSEDEPAYTTPAFDNAIVQAMVEIVENHSQTREAVLDRTKVAFDAEKGTLNKTAEAGVNLIKALYGDENLDHKGDRTDKNEMLMMQLSGRYGIIPSIPAMASDAAKKSLTDKGIQFLDKNSVLEKFKKNNLQEVKAGTDDATQKAVQSYFNQYYPEISSGDGYVQKTGNQWFTYNNRWTGFPESSLVQSAEFNNSVFSKGTAVTYDPYTYINMEENKNGVNISFNNYFVDKSDVWENYTNRWDGDYNLLFTDYLMENYIPKDKTRDNEFKTATITWKGLSGKPIIRNLTGLEGQYNQPEETWNEQKGEYTLRITANGYMNFEVVKSLDLKGLTEQIQGAGKVDRTRYTQSSLQRLDKAVENANKLIEDQLNASQEEIAAAEKEIKDAMTALVKLPANLAGLNQEIARAGSIKRNLYTIQSLTVLDKAVAAAQSLAKESLNIDRQTDIDKAVQELRAAQNNLKKCADKTGIRNAVLKAGKITRSSYTPQTLKLMDNAVKEANQMLGADLAAWDQTRVNQAAKAVEDAIKKLVKAAPKKGAVIISGNYRYKVTASTSKTKTLTFMSPRKNSYTKVSVPSSVKVNGYTFKVTALGDKAFKNNKKLTGVTIGSNVKSIGKQCFYGCGRLKNITIRSTSLKTAGKDALKKISSKAVIKVPSSKVSLYKKVLKNKGQGKNVVIKK